MSQRVKGLILIWRPERFHGWSEKLWGSPDCPQRLRPAAENVSCHYSLTYKQNTFIVATQALLTLHRPYCKGKRSDPAGFQCTQKQISSLGNIIQTKYTKYLLRCLNQAHKPVVLAGHEVLTYKCLWFLTYRILVCYWRKNTRYLLPFFSWLLLRFSL